LGIDDFALAQDFEFGRQLRRANEAALAGCDEVEVRRRVAAVADVMENCIKRGLGAEGQLPGGLNVRRFNWFRRHCANNSSQFL
jgi:L-serine deaminase